jgi:hypothetical protein
MTLAKMLGLSSTGAPTAVVFSGVSVRACNNAFLRRREERSIFNAEADASLIFSFSAGGKASGATAVDAFRLGALSFIRSTLAVKAAISSDL